MIHTMTDETYAVNCALSPEDPNRRQVMFLSHCFLEFTGWREQYFGEFIWSAVRSDSRWHVDFV